MQVLADKDNLLLKEYGWQHFVECVFVEQFEDRDDPAAHVCVGQLGLLRIEFERVVSEDEFIVVVVDDFDFVEGVYDFIVWLVEKGFNELAVDCQ